MSMWCTLALATGLTLAASEGFLYLPGVAPRNYQALEQVDLRVNKMDSVKTQLDYEYYSLPFCKPEEGITEESENLGEILAGDAITNSRYQIRMKKLESCKILCKMDYTVEEMKQFEDKVRDDYHVNWIIDNMPSATVFVVEEEKDGVTSEELIYMKGYKLGYVDTKESGEVGEAYINNHVRLIILYHEDQASFTGYRIVGFQVEPFSVKHQTDGPYVDENTPLKTCNALKPITSGEALPAQAVSGNMADRSIIWTYDVTWEASDIKWASRWDLYFKILDSEIHWFSILNSIMVVLFLSGLIAMIMLRTLHRDLARYNEELTEEEQAEETGWKLIHGDVFRSPTRGGLFSILIGTGHQLAAMVVLTLAFACFGFLSPANRGGLMTALLLVFVFMGSFAGYFATRQFKMFKLTEWKRNTFQTAIFFPGITFSVFFILNLFVWGEKASGAVPFGTLVALLVLWFGISFPLVYVGSYFAFKKPAIEHPLRVHNIPRLLPEQQQFQNHILVTIGLGGFVPFAACFVELFFIMSSVWQHQFYYVFPILTVVFFIVIITCAETSIVLCYMQLCSEDYRWWWRSYISSASFGLFVFGYSISYFMISLNITHFVSAILYFGYMLLASFALSVVTGTVGHVATWYFVCKIYSSIKID